MNQTAPYPIFGKTRNVKLEVYLNGKRLENPIEWDEEHWIEIPEDEYGLSSSDFRNKLVRVIRRKDWLESKDI